jgi:SAM-dependent methyltransferase
MAVLHSDISTEDVVLDIGCSSGIFALRAARLAHMPAHLIGLDVQEDAFRKHFPTDHSRIGFSFVQGSGEAIPLPTDSVAVTTAHNVLFRAHDIDDMLNEMKRVTQADGLIIISTNFRNHALSRHLWERTIAETVSTELDIPIEPVLPPAEGCYFEDLAGIVAQSGGLEAIDTVIQEDVALITPGERFETFLTSLYYSVNYTDLPTCFYSRWRNVVDRTIQPLLLESYDRQSRDEPVFTDTVHRGMVVWRNHKT